MIKHLRFFMLNLLVLVSAAVMAQNEAVWKSLTFPDENKNNNKCQGYTKTWTAKIGDATWSVSNFNNNNWGWTHIRCGSKKNASVASIINDAAFTKAVTKVVVKISEAKQLDKVNSINLVVAKDKTCKDIVETVAGIETVAGSFGEETTFAGDLTFNITAPAKNLFYKLVIDMKGGSSNGFIHIDGIDYYAGLPIQAHRSPSVRTLTARHSPYVRATASQTRRLPLLRLTQKAQSATQATTRRLSA